MTGVLIKKREIDTCREKMMWRHPERMTYDMKAEAEIMHLLAKECMRLPKARA